MSGFKRYAVNLRCQFRLIYYWFLRFSSVSWSWYKAMHARQPTHSNVRLFCLWGVCVSFLSLSLIARKVWKYSVIYSYYRLYPVLDALLTKQKKIIRVWWNLIDIKGKIPLLYVQLKVFECIWYNPKQKQIQKQKLKNREEKIEFVYTL